MNANKKERNHEEKREKWWEQIKKNDNEKERKKDERKENEWR